MNLKGEFNTENITRYEGYLESHDWEDILKKGLERDPNNLLEYSTSRDFYLILWHLQDYFNNPLKCQDFGQLKLFENVESKICAMFNIIDVDGRFASIRLLQYSRSAIQQPQFVYIIQRFLCEVSLAVFTLAARSN